MKEARILERTYGKMGVSLGTEGRMKTPRFKQETEEGTRRLMRADRIIHNRTRAANRECANERSTCANRKY